VTLHLMSQSNPVNYILEEQHSGILQTMIKGKKVPIISRRFCYYTINWISITNNLRR